MGRPTEQHDLRQSTRKASIPKYIKEELSKPVYLCDNLSDGRYGGHALRIWRYNLEPALPTANYHWTGTEFLSAQSLTAMFSYPFFQNVSTA